MKAEQTLEELERVAAKLGVRVSYDALGGDVGQGGLCKVKGDWRVIVDRRATASEKAALLAQSLSRFDVEAIFMPEEVRRLLQHHRQSS
jgi:hypothetical protein